MRFQITIKAGYQKNTIIVERIHLDERTERYKLIGRDRSIVLESNRPFFRNRGLMHRKPDWKIVEGQAMNGQPFEATIKAIMAVVDK